VRAPSPIRAVEVGQLDAQQRCLERIQALVVSKLHVLTLGALAEMAQAPQPRREHLVVGAHRAAVPQRAEVLGRIERERRRRPERTDPLLTVPRAMRLRRVLQNQQAVWPRERLDRGHVACLTVEVDGEDGRGP